MGGNRRKGHGKKGPKKTEAEICQLCPCEKGGQPCKNCEKTKTCEGNCDCCESYRNQKPNPSNEKQVLPNASDASVSRCGTLTVSPIKKLHGNEGNVCELCSCTEKVKQCQDCQPDFGCLGSCKCCESYRQIIWWRVLKPRMPLEISEGSTYEPRQRSDQSSSNRLRPHPAIAPKYCMCDGGQECDICRGGKNFECRFTCSCCKRYGKLMYRINELEEDFVVVDGVEALNLDESCGSSNIQAASSDEYGSLSGKYDECVFCACSDEKPCAICTEQLNYECLGTCKCCTGYRNSMKNVLKEATVKLKEKEKNDDIKPEQDSHDGTYCHECDCMSIARGCGKCAKNSFNCGGSCTCCRKNRIKLYDTLRKMLLKTNSAKYDNRTAPVIHDNTDENASTCNSCDCKFLDKPCDWCKDCNFTCRGECPCCENHRNKKT